MRFLFVIDSLGSGGAQKQLVTLAVGLTERGHEVDFFYYYPELDFYKPELEAASIQCFSTRKRSRLGLNVVFSLTGLINKNSYQVVLSYLDTPNFYLELASLLAKRKPVTVVSERLGNNVTAQSISSRIKRQFHRLADQVVVNSHDHKNWLKTNYPGLTGKVCCIYNGVKTERFSQTRQSEGYLLAIGRVSAQKNILLLINALEAFHEEHGWSPTIKWLGRDDESEYATATRHALSAKPQLTWQWLGEKKDVETYLANCDALIHPALFEGLPNVVCEALVAGVPVLASDVGDHHLLVKNSERGQLFDPHSVSSIKDSISWFYDLTPDQRHQMETACREYGIAHLAADRLIDEYEHLFEDLSKEHAS